MPAKKYRQSTADERRKTYIDMFIGGIAAAAVLTVLVFISLNSLGLQNIVLPNAFFVLFFLIFLFANISAIARKLIFEHPFALRGSHIGAATFDKLQHITSLNSDYDRERWRVRVLTPEEWRKSVTTSRIFFGIWGLLILAEIGLQAWLYKINQTSETLWTISIWRTDLFMFFASCLGIFFFTNGLVRMMQDMVRMAKHVKNWVIFALSESFVIVLAFSGIVIFALFTMALGNGLFINRKSNEVITVVIDKHLLTEQEKNQGVTAPFRMKFEFEPDTDYPVHEVVYQRLEVGDKVKVKRGIMGWPEYIEGIDE